MKVAIMQPYFFPYLGYFQLISAVDFFVIFDDVNYIKRGWINKNRILQNGEISNITLPIQKASQNRKINQHNRTVDTKVLEKLKKQIQFSYAKAPNFKKLYPLVEKIINNEEVNLSTYLANSLKELSLYMGFKTQFLYSSSLSTHEDFDNSEQRIIKMVQQLGGTQYFNLSGGIDLYSLPKFKQNNLALSFLNAKIEPYKQLSSTSFIPGLSIIDVLMNNDL